MSTGGFDGSQRPGKVVYNDRSFNRIERSVVVKVAFKMLAGIFSVAAVVVARSCNSYGEEAVETPDMVLDKGTEHLLAGRTDEAIAEYDRAIEMRPAFASAYYNRGLAYSYKGDTTLALKDYTKAIDLEPGMYQAFYNRGNLYMAEGFNDKAARDFTSTIELDANHVGAYSNRGFVNLVRLGKKEEGCADMKKACTLGVCTNIELARGDKLCE